MGILGPSAFLCGLVVVWALVRRCSGWASHSRLLIRPQRRRRGSWVHSDRSNLAQGDS
ncbi:hypothetical protein M406DRAFT_321764 [Cryphonectria parasitica EP155]|uniref:Uncharacterized protein n=1 Tax=Cryphonectria parasitica (strain ATCC 38755 / EP155) TaxID=660469 RepID=A0A9P4Y7J8_CRYP1|nr:uncharacterized protein M406DRAFT_321764 [Cryphonectria parasitica EP155]KAF3767894.1 hypothetical protein M406DRAFT_321764 [Cryphonectria parasitica EP155]